MDVDFTNCFAGSVRKPLHELRGGSGQSAPISLHASHTSVEAPLMTVMPSFTEEQSDSVGSGKHIALTT